MKHVLITAPSSEPVTAVNVKLHAGVTHDVEDTLITSWIKSGRIIAENFQHRAFIDQEWGIYLDGFPLLPLDIPRPPLSSVDSIKYYDTDDSETTWSTDDYDVDTDSEIGRVSFKWGKHWPAVILRPTNGFKILYTAGYGSSADDVPDSVKDALYLYCAWRYDNRTGESEIPKAFFNILTPDRMAIY